MMRLGVSVCVLAVATCAAPGTAVGASVRSVWDYRTTDMERSNLLPADCSSVEGRVLVLGRATTRDASPMALMLTATGEAEQKTFPELPGDAGRVRNPRACLWLDDGSILVLVDTDQNTSGAIWLSSTFSITRWLVLEAKRADTQPFSMAEIRPGEFVTVGMHTLHPIALRFDSRRVAQVALPWVDGPEGMLKDIEPDHRGGFSVCGHEVRVEGGSVLTVETVIAVFDEEGKVRAQARLPGRGCALLPSRAGIVRVLHDDGANEHTVLRLTTFDSTLDTLSDEPLMTNFAPAMKIPSFEARERIIFASPWYGWETLEIRGPSGPQSFDLDVDPGGLIDLLPGPSRIYVVSAPYNRQAPKGQSAFGLRVEAFDLESP